MKKYFMKGTQDEVQFGDMLELDFTKDTKNGTIHKHLELKFIPELVDVLIEEDVIEEKNCLSEKKPAEGINFNVENKPRMTSLGEELCDIKNRLTELEGIVAELLSD